MHDVLLESELEPAIQSIFIHMPILEDEDVIGVHEVDFDIYLN